MLGTPRGLRRLRRLLPTENERQRRGRAFIVGGGLVGAAVAEELGDAGWQVKILESSHDRCQELASQLDCLVLHGDGTDLDTLEQEVGDEPDALIAVTSNDEKNLLISLLGQYLGIPRVITRADRLVNERIFERVGVDVVLSAKGAAIRRVVNDYVESDEVHVADLEHGDFSVLDINLPIDFAKIALRDLNLPGFAIIGAIVRGRRVKLPQGNDVIEAGDRLLIVCDHDHEEELRAALELEDPFDGST